MQGRLQSRRTQDIFNRLVDRHGAVDIYECTNISKRFSFSKKVYLLSRFKFILILLKYHLLRCRSLADTSPICPDSSPICPDFDPASCVPDWYLLHHFDPASGVETSSHLACDGIQSNWLLLWMWIYMNWQDAIYIF